MEEENTDTNEEHLCAACDKPFSEEELTKGVCAGCREQAAAVGITFDADEPEEASVRGELKDDVEPSPISEEVKEEALADLAEKKGIIIEEEEPTVIETEKHPVPEPEMGENGFSKPPECYGMYHNKPCVDPLACLHYAKCLPSSVKAAKKVRNEFNQRNKELTAEFNATQKLLSEHDLVDPMA